MDATTRFWLWWIAFMACGGLVLHGMTIGATWTQFAAVAGVACWGGLWWAAMLSSREHKP